MVVEPSGAKRWAFLYRWKQTPAAAGVGRLREMGLGSVHSVSLARAREKAAEARALIAERKDPITARKAQNAVPTFGAVAEEMIEAKSVELRGAKSKARWLRSLNTYSAALKPLPVDQVTTEHVLGVLRPIWTTKAETAQKTRGFVEAVLDAGKARGLRAGENPARWRGHLDHLLPKRLKLTRGHHAAMPFDDVPEFMARLRAQNPISARALEFTILTAARTGEVVGATWSEIDTRAAVWTVPAARAKAERTHRVPLSAPAIALLDELSHLRISDYVFPGQRSGRSISTGAMDAMLQRMGADNITVHGFRSSFRDWAGECTDFPREIAEAALAHSVGDETERAYRRGDALDRRRHLMDAWAEYCAGAVSDRS